MRLNKWPVLLLALCLLATGTAMAQSSRGGIKGTAVMDTGEALAGVMVTLLSVGLEG